jgi:type I restriction enzyme, S subunit
VAAPYLLCEGDILFARSGATVGKTFRYDPSWGAAAHAGYLIRARVHLQRADSRFVVYFTQSGMYWGWLRSSFIQSTIQNVSAERYASLFLPLPSLGEQHAIVAFLDRETARVDALIAKKERLIELLQEKRAALITRTVTRGLDPTVPTKDSGVEWLGQIPAHWETHELRRLTRRGTTITYGIVQAGPDIEDGVPYIRASDMAGESLPKTGYQKTSPQIDAAYRRSKVSAGDLVIAIRATVGKALLVPDYLDGANLTQGTAKVSPGEGLLTRYLLAALQSLSVQQRFEALSKGATFREITLHMLRRVAIPVPPLVEQEEIVHLLDTNVARMDALVAKVREAIERLKELRTALISAAVTGKIDVRAA